MTLYDETQSFGLLIADISRLLRKVFDNELKCMSCVSSAQWHVLAALGRENGLSQIELADRAEIEQSSLVRHLDNLETAGLIERRADKDDRRMKRIYLTDSSIPLFDTLSPIVMKLRQNLTRDLDKNEFEQMMKGLHSIKTRAAELLESETEHAK